MATLIGWGALCIILLVFLAKVKKAGSDEVRADAAEKSLEKATEANRPVTDSERERVVQLFKRR